MSVDIDDFNDLAEEAEALRFQRDELRAEIERLAAENERLRALVRSAYFEGFSEGMNEHTKFRGGKPWEDSRTCRALEGVKG